MLEDKKVWQDYKLILIVAIFLRLIASIFSQGYGMHDDQFLVIEAASEWLNIPEGNKWLPWNPENNGPEGHSFVYVGLQFLFFYVLKAVGIVNPKVLMLLVRLCHAAFSMLTVVYGIKITELLSGKRAASIVGWLLAALWLFPFISVRQLFETTPIPFLMVGLWFLLKYPSNLKYVFYAGLLMGMAASFRYQIGVFAVGIATVLLFTKAWKSFAWFCLGVVVLFSITQSVPDIIIWGYPFVEMRAYVVYNMNEGTQYLKNTNYFMYFWVLIGVNLVPLGLLLFAGFLKTQKRLMIIFIPALFFLIFHSFYPNRQERFILTILPMFIILGVIGFETIKKNGFDSKLWKISWISFWVLNIPVLLFVTTMYSKKSRVEAMYSIYDSPLKNKNMLMEGTGNQRTSLLPQFYSKDWGGRIISRVDTLVPLQEVKDAKIDYIFFFDEENLPKRIQEYKTIYPSMTLHKKCYPSNLDVLLRKMNPRNANEYIEVWQTNIRTK